MYDFKQIHCTISQNNFVIRDWLNDPMNSIFSLKSFDPRSLTELCLSDQNFCGFSHPANSTFYVLLARFQVGGILQELLRNSDWKISCLCLITFLPTFSYSLENHASRTEGLELARERDTACANAWVRSFLKNIYQIIKIQIFWEGHKNFAHLPLII